MVGLRATPSVTDRSEVLMDDIKKAGRELETETRKRVRDLDGHDVGDDIGNAGDEIRKDLGNVGDDIRRELGEVGDDLHREGHETWERNEPVRNPR
jgi:hypothetical protein